MTTDKARPIAILLLAAAVALAAAPAAWAQGKGPPASRAGATHEVWAGDRSVNQIIVDILNDILVEDDGAVRTLGGRGLPPGLAKRDGLPPGLERHVQRTGQLPPGLQKQLAYGIETGVDGVVVDIEGVSVIVRDRTTGQILKTVQNVLDLGRALSRGGPAG